MTGKSFIAENNPTDERCRQLEQLVDPVIPYYTAQYRTAMQSCGKSVWLLATQLDGGITTGCLGEIESGRLRRELQIQSTPQNADETFWRGLSAFCKAQRITSIRLGTIGTAPEIPALGELTEEKLRCEYWVDLSADLKSRMRPEQRRIYNRAVDAGLSIRQPSLQEGLKTHRELTSASLGRRRTRGESIPQFGESGIAAALIKAGVGRMYECLLGDKVIGSVILTVASTGAHGYSAGYSAEGLKAGAGVYLNLSTFQILKDEGKTLFNLGDAPPDSGLALFKKGLGGVQHASRAAQFSVATPMQRVILNAEAAVRGTLQTVQNKFTTVLGSQENSASKP